MTEKRLIADAAIVGNLMQRQRQKEREENMKGTARVGKTEGEGKKEAHSLVWGILYTD